MAYSSAVSTVGGGISSAYAQHQAGAFNKKIANFNAHVDDLEASQAIVNGRIAVNRHETQVLGLEGAQRAAFAGQGVVVNSGSAGQVTADTSRQAAIDEQTIRNNAALQAWGFRVQAAGTRTQGELGARAADNQAIGTILSSTGRAAGMWPRASAPPSNPSPNASPNIANYGGSFGSAGSTDLNMPKDLG